MRNIVGNTLSEPQQLSVAQRFGVCLEQLVLERFWKCMCVGNEHCSCYAYKFRKQHCLLHDLPLCH